jgi:diketogulonate reductase-like aldo/keto reductase
MKTVTLPDGTRVPALGQGTWGMGEKKSAHATEVAALRLGIDLGMTLIDTAEMYGDGGAEKVVADAIEGQRDRVFIVTKAYPRNASRTELPKACDRSLKRLRIETIDLECDVKENCQAPRRHYRTDCARLGATSAEFDRDSKSE